MAVYRSGVKKVATPLPTTATVIDPVSGLMTTEFQTFLLSLVEQTQQALDLGVILLAGGGVQPSAQLNDNLLSLEGFIMAASLVHAIKGVYAPAAPATFYTVPPNNKLQVTNGTLVSSSGTLQLMSVYFVPPGGVPGPDNAILYKQPIAAGASVAYPQMNHLLDAGTTIQVECNAPAVVSVQVSGALL